MRTSGGKTAGAIATFCCTPPGEGTGTGFIHDGEWFGILICRRPGASRRRGPVATSITFLRKRLVPDFTARSRRKRAHLPLARRPCRRRQGGRAIEGRGMGEFRQVDGSPYRPRHAVTIGTFIRPIRDQVL